MRASDQDRVLRLGPLESQVMNILWDNGPSTIKEIIDGLGGEMAYTTIATVLTNLQRKHLVTSQKKGRSAYFSAGLTREEFAAQTIDQVLEASNDRAASILHFVKSMSDDDLDLLRGYLADNPGSE